MLAAVIADDLTGAADTAVEFAKQGYSAAALVRWQGSPLLAASLLAVDAESRHLAPSAAYHRVREAASALQAAGCRRFYKKMDSALRGNLGAEIDAVLDATGLSFAVVAPAFPANGRTTLDGRQRDRGLPLDQTAFAQDPSCPITESHLPTLLATQTRRRIASLGTGIVRQGPEQLKAALEREHRSGRGILVLDAETDSDLATIAIALEGLEGVALAVGSAGLAEHCARLLPAAPAGQDTASLERTGPVLVVAGSIHPRTRAQVERLLSATTVSLIELPTEGILARWEAPATPVTVLRLERVDRPPSLAGCQRLVERLAVRVGEAMADRYFRGLVLVGGDTAVAVLSVLGASGLLVESEVQPGVAAGRLIGGDHDGLPVVTKAGGLGDDQALVSALVHLAGPS